MNAAAKKLGGWYYKKFGNTPGGFHFPTEEARSKFMQLQSSSVDRSEELGAKREAKATTRASGLRERATAMHEAAEAEHNAERKENTHRRSGMADGIRARAAGQMATAKLMHKIADKIDANETSHLAGVSAGTHVNELKRQMTLAKHAALRGSDAPQDKWDAPPSAEHIEHAQYPYPSIQPHVLKDIAGSLKSEPGFMRFANKASKLASKDTPTKITDPSDIAMFDRVSRKLKQDPKHKYLGERLASEVESYNRLQNMDIKNGHELRAALREFQGLRGDSGSPKADPVREAEKKLRFRKIDGFFPTPKPLVSTMLEHANIQDGDSVLEPSAGKGDIMDSIREMHPGANVSGLEMNRTFDDVLKAKGHNVGFGDFLDHTGQYDRIVMNPPFEKRQDEAHVKHAFGLLKPGGRVVAIVGAGATGNQRSKDFQDWLKSVGGEVHDNPDGAFKGDDAFRQTGVNSKMIVIDKPEKDRHSVGFRPLLLDRPASVTSIVDRYWNTIRNDDLYLAPESPVVDRYDWNSAQHPRHPAGAPQGAGGEFSGHGGGSATKGFAQSNRLGAVSASIASQWGNKPAAAMPSVKRELAHLPQIDRSHALHRSQLGPHVDSQLLNWNYRMHELLRPMDKMPPTVTKLSGDEQAEAGWAKVDKNKVRAMLEELNQMDRDMKAKGVPLSDYVNASGIIPRELAVRLDGGSRFFNPELLGNKLRDGRREPEEKPSEKPSPAQPKQPKRAAAEAKPNKPAPAPIPSGMSKVGSNKLNGIVSEVVGDADPAKKEHFRQVALDAWKQMRTDAEDHNTAVREIMGQFTKAGHGGIAAALKKGADPTKIRGFDEMVDYAAREFPSVVSHMAGESESGSAEEGLVKALTKGIQPIPQPWDDEVIDRAIEMVGPMFFEEYQPEESSQEDFEPIPFAAKMERAREVARYWLRSEPERYAASADIAKPTEAQKLAGNYRMGHVRIHGLDITIETPKGRSRRDGWPKLSCDYGYFKKTLGRDGDHVDVFVGPDKTSEMVYVIDQPNGSGGFDEHKVLIGFRSQNAAIAAYRDCYTTGWIVGKVTAMTVEQFKAWLAKGSQNKPIAGQVSRYWEKHSLTERYASSSRQ